MQVFASATRSTGGSGSSVSLVRPEFRKNYKIPILDYQKGGIISRSLWTTKNHILRIIPGHDKNTGEVFRQNINCAQYSPEDDATEHLSDTFTMVNVCSKFGQNKLPFVTDYRPGTPDQEKWQGNTVIHMFCREIINACNPKAKGRKRLTPTNEWRMWTGIGPQSMIAYDSKALLMQALVFMVNGTVNTDLETEQELRDADGDILPLLAVVALEKKSAIINLCQALVQPKDMGLPLDASTNNTYGPMAELEGNKLFLNTVTDATTGKATLKPSVQAPGKGWTPSPFPLSEEIAKALWTPWEDLLNFMTAQEQLELCAREFGADTVNYVIGTDPFFATLPIPEKIRSAGLGRYANAGGTVSMSGTLSQPSQPTTPTFSMAKGLGMASKPALSGTPAQPQVSELKGVGAGIDTDKLLKDVAALRKAAAKATDQSQDASDLLDDEPILGGN